MKFAFCTQYFTFFFVRGNNVNLDIFIPPAANLCEYKWKFTLFVFRPEPFNANIFKGKRNKFV